MTPYTLETVTGKHFDPVEIDPEQIDITDIAWSLSRISRFAGHTVTEVPYNVAQHSVFVADMILQDTGDKICALGGLLHDAAECYIGDIPSPIKKIPEMKAVIDPIEENIIRAIFLKYMGRLDAGIQFKYWTAIKFFDKKACAIEAHAFMHSRGAQWPGREDYDITLLELQQFESPQTSIVSYELFLNKFNELSTLVS